MPQTVSKLLSLSFPIFLVLFFAATVPGSLRAAYLAGLEKGIEEGSKQRPSGISSSFAAQSRISDRSRAVGRCEYRFGGRQASRFFCEFCRSRSAPQSGAVAGIQSAYCCPCKPQVQPRVSSFPGKGAADRRPGQRRSPRFRIAGF